MKRVKLISVLFCMLFAGALNMIAQDVTITISPAPGEYETLPSVFTVTIDGPQSISSNIFVGNPMLIVSPKGNRQRVPARFSGHTITFTVPSTYALDEPGQYSVTLMNEAANCTWADGSKTKTEEKEFLYDVIGKEEKPYVPTEVVYDIQMIKTIPVTTPFDLADFDLETLQLYFDKGDLHLDPAASAIAAITGPDYEKRAALHFNMNMPTATVFNIQLNENPVYSGKYVLTIPQGILGDEEWMNDHAYGHSNAAVNYEFSVIHGVSQATAEVSVSPVPGEYDTLPDEFVISVEGPKSLSKNVAGGNPLLITSPKGHTQQVSGTISGNTITCKVPSTFALDERGDYKVKFRGGSIDYNYDDGTTKSTDQEWVYNVIGKEEETPDVPKEVVYDLELLKTTPNLEPLDLEMYGLETLQLNFKGANLEIAKDADAVVTVSGPNFYSTVGLLPNFSFGTVTIFKAMFPKDPVYNGTYTLTIPQGVLGDEVWIKNHKLGHSNPEINLEFTVINGEDPSTITQDLTFNPQVSPSPGSKASDLSKVYLTFNSTPYCDTTTPLEVYIRQDLSESGTTSLYGSARIVKGSGNVVTLELSPAPSSNAQYSITIPEGTFWNQAHENDANGGSLNGEMPLYWYYVYAPAVELSVTGHTPATDARVTSFPANQECITIKTNVRNQVASADIEVTEYKLDDDSAMPRTVLNVSTTDVNDEGYICWVNRTGSDIDLPDGYYYEVSYVLKNNTGNTLADGSFEFYGAKEEETPDVPTDVAYDIEMNKTLPALRPLDLENYGLETLQLYFNMADLQIASTEDAKVTITGPNYNSIVPLQPNLNLDGVTVFKAMFSDDPVYNGTYTLTIPQGVLGDEAWIKDHRYGHSNAAVDYEFTVINGQDPSTITVDLTFNPQVNPAAGTKVSDLSSVTLTFASDPYFNAATELDVNYLADLGSTDAPVAFGKAKIVKGEGNEVTLELTPAPVANGEYSITLPEGTFWNEEHANDENAGSLNGEMTLHWQFVAPVEEVLEVTGHTPATDARVSSFPADQECITIRTNLPDKVASAQIKLIEYKLDDDTSAPKTLLDVATTDFNDEGYICWVNRTGAEIDLWDGYYYEVNYVLKNEDGNTLADGSFEFYGAKEEIPDVPADVAYDIEMNKTLPALRPLDLENYGLETLQLYFNMADLQIASDADVTITGPNYNATVALQPNFSMEGLTVFKAMFSDDPVYNGTYTLTIPQGVLGDEDWIKDHRYGHSNAAVDYEFTVINGQDPSTITVDLTFNPQVAPASGTKVSDLSKVTLTFASEPYCDASPELAVYYRADLSESGSTENFGKAKIVKGEGNEITLELTPVPSANGEYSMTLPEGTFWNEEHANDENAGSLNGEMSLHWQFVAPVEEVLEVTGHTPATDARVSSFPADQECITIRTNLPDKVASADIKVTGYKLNDETALPETVLDVTTTDFNDEGYICWVNRTGAEIDLWDGYYYEVSFTLKDEGGKVLAEDSFEFYGSKQQSGINEIIIDHSSRIFNLQGFEVKGKELPAGIYIVDGKKMVIRK